MTANKPTLTDHQYHGAEQIACAWRNDTKNNVMYFYNNRHVGITTCQDDDILRILRGEPPNTALHPTGAGRS